jgi:hypothetical protein
MLNIVRHAEFNSASPVMLNLFQHHLNQGIPDQVRNDALAMTFCAKFLFFAERRVEGQVAR